MRGYKHLPIVLALAINIPCLTSAFSNHQHDGVTFLDGNAKLFSRKTDTFGSLKAFSTMDVLASTAPGRLHALSSLKLSSSSNENESQDEKPKKSTSTTTFDENYVEKIRNNLTAGETGERGEIYVIAQGLLLLSILVGDFPLLDNSLPFLFGPCLILIGSIIIASGVNELGDALSPFPVPVDVPSDPSTNSTDVDSLKTSGIFAYMRHPLYCGLLCMCAGFGVWTESVMRLSLTVLLYACLSLKMDYEEEALLELYPEAYKEYMDNVPGRIFPMPNVQD